MPNEGATCRYGLFQMKNIYLIALLIVVATAPIAVRSEAFDSDDKNVSQSMNAIHDSDFSGVVKETMDEQYGENYDIRNSCWAYSYKSDNGDDVTYCMKPSMPELVDTESGKQLYFFAANAFDIHHDARYSYADSDPGLMGAFKLKKDLNGAWSILSSNKAMQFGTIGYCGCNKARLVKLSNAGNYGWMFVSGGVWQGIVVSDYSIVVAHEHTFEDISAIPETKENDQDTTYNIEFVARNAGDENMFPLKVTKIKTGAKNVIFMVNFDEDKHQYALHDGN
jgi:hypothetical protein